MEFRKKIKIENAGEEITYSSNIMSVGSCFSDNIGGELTKCKFSIIQNPQGIIFNPIALANVFETENSSSVFSKDGKSYSWTHHSSVNEMNQESLLERITKSKNKVNDFLKKTTHIFVTFGSAWGYRHVKNNMIVANCHKMPQDEFAKELSSVHEIVAVWSEIIAKYPHINWIFTVSPVRHWKDGVRENNVSKGVLHQSIHELLKLKNVNYFPSYEIIIDELRDYRFFKNDMLHPNDLAVDYVWEKFGETYFSEKNLKIVSEVEKLNRMKAHRIMDVGSNESEAFMKELEKQEGKVALLLNSN